MPPQTQTQKKKKGFGEKLKGVGRRIVQEAKKVPGTIYREGIKPEAKRILEKFTEEGPSPGRPISGEPQAGTTAAPFERGPKGLKRAINPRPARGGVSQPAPKAQTIAEMVAPVSRPAAKHYPLAGGRTTAYDPSFTGSKGAVERLAEIRAKEKGTSTPKRATTISEAVKVTSEKPLVEKTTQTTGRTTTKKKAQARGKLRGYEQPVFKATATAPKAEAAAVKGGPPPKITKEQRHARAQRQRAGLMKSRKGKPGKRKYSATKTYKEIGKAAAASQKPLDIERLDTTALEVARAMTEQDVGREAERAEAALKQGRKPTREKARYRYQTRGYKRSEGRGR